MLCLRALQGLMNCVGCKQLTGKVPAPPAGFNEGLNLVEAAPNRLLEGLRAWQQQQWQRHSKALRDRTSPQRTDDSSLDRLFLFALHMARHLQVLKMHCPFGLEINLTSTAENHL